MNRRHLLTVLGVTLSGGCLQLSGSGGESGAAGTARANSTPTVTDSPTPSPTDSPTPTPRPDVDGDGVPDKEDAYPNDPNRQRDSDGDGVADSRDEYPNDPQREEDTDGDGVADEFDDYPENSNYTELVDELNDTFDLNEDYYQYYDFSVEEETDLFYEVEVQEDIQIDVFLTDATNFGYFEDGAEWSYYTDGSDFSTVSAEETFTLDTDRTYYLVIDHTEDGVAEPPANGTNDRLTIELGLVLAR